MLESDKALVKRIGIGCIAAFLLLVGLIIVGFQTGYLKVVQDLSSGPGEAE